MSFLRLAVTCSLVLLAFHGLAVAQKLTVDPLPPQPQIKTSIAIESATPTAGEPVMVTVTVQNLSGAELEVSSICSFRLKNLSKEVAARKHEVFGDSYWGPVNIATGTRQTLTIIDPEKEKQGIIVGRVPENSIHLSKDETKTFKVDLTKLLWNPTMSSMWPDQPLFKVVKKGSYALSFEMSKKDVNVKSNDVEVSIK